MKWRRLRAKTRKKKKTSKDQSLKETALDDAVYSENIDVSQPTPQSPTPDAQQELQIMTPRQIYSSAPDGSDEFVPKVPDVSVVDDDNHEQVVLSDRRPSAADLLTALARKETALAAKSGKSTAPTIDSEGTFQTAMIESPDLSEDSLSPARSESEAPSLAHENLTSPAANPRDNSSLGLY